MIKNVIIPTCFFFFLIFFLESCTSEPTSNSTISEQTHFKTKKDLLPHHLTSVDTIKKWMKEGRSMTIFEISKKEKYEQGHLPNAIHLWRPDYENKTDYPYGGMMASKVDMETLLSINGVQNDSQIVLYDTKGSSDAMRLCWILRSYGYENVLVINGGKTAWKQAGYQLSKKVPQINPVPSSPFTFSEDNKHIPIARLQDVQAAIIDSNTILLDTREPAEYKGQPYIDKNKLFPYKKGAFANGCIPGAKHLNWSDAVDLNQDHCFKSLKDLRYNFEQAGIFPDKKIITYCQSGVRSAHTAFVLKDMLNYPNVMNYDGSWIEWSYYYVNGKKVDIEQHTPPLEFEKMLADLQKKLHQQK